MAIAISTLNNKWKKKSSGFISNLILLKAYWKTLGLGFQFLFKRNAQFLFLCNPHKSGASQVCIPFFSSNSKNTN